MAKHKKGNTKWLYHRAVTLGAKIKKLKKQQIEVLVALTAAQARVRS